MNSQHLHLCAFLVSCICYLPTSSYSQVFSQPEAILSTGGTSETDQYLWQYSLGETIIYESEDGMNFRLTQGVQQPTDIIISTEVIPDGWSIQLFPNPTAGLLVVNYQLPQATELNAKLLAANGQLVRQERLNSLDQQFYLDLSSLPAGSYLLQMHADNGHAQQATFQVIKQ